MAVTINADTTNGLVITPDTSGDLSFQSSGSNIFTIDSSGNTVFSGALSWSGDLAVDTNTLYVDATNNRVGIGTTSPSSKLDVAGAVTIQGNNGAGTLNTLQFKDTDTATASGQDIGAIEFYSADASNAGVQAYIKGQADGSSGVGRLTFGTGTGASVTERMRIDSSGNVGIGTGGVAAAGVLDVEKAVGAEGVVYCIMRNNNGTKINSLVVNSVATQSYNTAVAAVWVGRSTLNGRGLNAGGTINATGADYAEYMVKNGKFTINKGDICGIDANGKLTNSFIEAVSFVVKSTDPSYVGGDKWGSDVEDPLELESRRQTVDRIAFCGQVPVNVLGASSGQYIVPINDNGLIKGEAISNPTFEQYKLAVGKVISIEDDGRAKIIVKVS